MAKSERKRGKPPAKNGDKGPRVGQLTNARQVIAELAAVYREARLGLTPLEDATKLAYILRELRQGFEQLAIEELLEIVAELKAETSNGDYLNGRLQIEARPIEGRGRGAGYIEATGATAGLSSADRQSRRDD